MTLEKLGARLRADMAELTSLRAALDCAVPQYPGDALQQLGYLIALAQPERRAPATAETVRLPPEPRP